jgi:hypothetical protein
MDTLATIARHRTVMATIADVIVAAAAGKSLRVAIGYTDPDETAFAEHLTHALHARGRPCRCLPPQPNPLTASDCTPPNSPILTVITSATPSPHDSDLCRIDIQLRAVTQPAGSGRSPHRREPDRQGPSTIDDDHQPDIIVDYLDPDGPTIRHLAPTLPPLPDRQ